MLHRIFTRQCYATEHHTLCLTTNRPFCFDNTHLCRCACPCCLAAALVCVVWGQHGARSVQVHGARNFLVPVGGDMGL